MRRGGGPPSLHGADGEFAEVPLFEFCMEAVEGLEGVFGGFFGLGFVRLWLGFDGLGLVRHAVLLIGTRLVGAVFFRLLDFRLFDNGLGRFLLVGG
jgi:hypothetical protein